MIKLEDVTKIYCGKEENMFALNKVNLQVKDGEFLAIVGTSGSGKTTLLNILGAMDRMTSGSYQFMGKCVENFTDAQFHAFRKKYISFVFQHFELMEHYTVYENVEMPLLVRNVKNRKQIVWDALDKMGISEKADELPGNLSGGQRQRCAIARALVTNAKVILADEPTGALDKKTSQDIMNVLKSINEKGKTIILITHDMEIANQCKRIVRLEDGEIVGL